MCLCAHAAGRGGVEPTAYTHSTAGSERHRLMDERDQYPCMEDELDAVQIWAFSYASLKDAKMVAGRERMKVVSKYNLFRSTQYLISTWL